MPSKTQRKQRVPKLSYTENRGIGWHVSYRDPKSGTPRKHRFGMMTQAQAEKEYLQWVAHFLDGILPEKTPRRTRKEMEERQAGSKKASVVPGSLLSVMSSLLDYERSRARKEGEPRRPGSISFTHYKERKKWGHDFLAFLNSRYGDGAVASMQLADLSMEDVEAFNRSLVEVGHSTRCSSSTAIHRSRVSMKRPSTSSSRWTFPSDHVFLMPDTHRPSMARVSFPVFSLRYCFQ